MTKLISIKKASLCLKQGDIIAYPTEAVYGLGCDPDDQYALERLIALKARDPTKGLLLIAASMEQLNFYVDFNLVPTAMMLKIKKSWPGFVTWVLPINQQNIDKISPILYGKFNTVAVRVSNHPVVIALCNLFAKPIVSTSANISRAVEIKDRKILAALFANKIAGIVDGELGNSDRPSPIINALTEEIIRE